MNHDLINQVESLKVMMVSRARGELMDHPDYSKIRRDLLASPKIAKLLPQCVHVFRSLTEFWGFIKGKFETYADRTDFLRVEFDPLLLMLESEARSPSDGAISAAVTKVNLDYIHEAWTKAIERRASDPEGAVTIARTLLESVCKHIIDSAKTPYDEGADLPKLYSLASNQLNLSPSQHTEQIFKQILSGCTSVVVGLGALRNKHSDAHGKGVLGTKPSPRHAELAVNLSGAMATFLLQTWDFVNSPLIKK
jgi:hypothetical protein